ncbi:hypothetical protein CEXT_723221 [Caerostris extrusa]|uniref:Uncharacterized protein n=1 Tax=Caerostris extrusa TaxID=172846 RepID=A0AAV4Y0C3_CAEEX|nr:hypothetical protein CEXT_723221 [Caerostris extrusa]
MSKTFDDVSLPACYYLLRSQHKSHISKHQIIPLFLKKAVKSCQPSMLFANEAFSAFNRNSVCSWRKPRRSVQELRIPEIAGGGMSVHFAAHVTVMDRRETLVKKKSPNGYGAH